MSNIMDRFLNSMKLTDEDDFDDDIDGGYDEQAEDPGHDDDDYDEEHEPHKGTSGKKKSFLGLFSRKHGKDGQTGRDGRRGASRDKQRASNILSFRDMEHNRGSADRSRDMEVCMVKPSTFNDSRQISDVLLSGRAVVINMDGMHIDLAQRIVDFTSGACYSIDGNLQKISNFIFIATPSNIQLSGSFQDQLDLDHFDDSFLVRG